MIFFIKQDLKVEIKNKFMNILIIITIYIINFRFSLIFIKFFNI